VQVLPDNLFINAVASLDVKQEVYDQQEAAASQIQLSRFFRLLYDRTELDPLTDTYHILLMRYYDEA
jgi:hypothetical protein